MALSDPSQSLFEAQWCGRCGGTGHYSYCQMYGTTCFGCNGQRIVLTKRGQAAAQYYREMFEIPLSEVKVGDVVRPSGMKSFVVKEVKQVGWHVQMEPKDGKGSYGRSSYEDFELTLASGEKKMASQMQPGEVVIEDSSIAKVMVVVKTTAQIHLDGDHGGYQACCDAKIWRAVSKEKVAEYREKALAYQATLGKSGKPLKSKKVAVAS